MKNIRPIILLSGLAFMIDGAAADSENDHNPWRAQSGIPLVIAHGGAKELYPENTVLAFEEVTKLDIDALEVDLSMTKDGVIVTHHDATINRMSDGTGRVDSYTYDELLAFDFAAGFAGVQENYPYTGHPKAVPATLEHLFEHYGDLMFVLELKDRGRSGKTAAEKVFELIKRFSMEEKVIIASFSDEVIRHVTELSNNSLMFSTPRREATRFVMHEKFKIGGLYKSRFDAFQVPTSGRVFGISFDLATKHLIELAHEKGMAVHYWTINAAEEMRRLINLGADGIITDRPDKLIDIVHTME